MKKLIVKLKPIAFAVFGAMLIRYFANGSLSEELIMFSIVYFGCITDKD